MLKRNPNIFSLSKRESGTPSMHVFTLFIYKASYELKFCVKTVCFDKKFAVYQKIRLSWTKQITFSCKYEWLIDRNLYFTRIWRWASNWFCQGEATTSSGNDNGNCVVSITIWIFKYIKYLIYKINILNKIFKI